MPWGYAAVAGIGAISANQQAQAAKGSANAAREELRRQNEIARADLSAYRQFGGEQLSSLQDWLKTPEGQFQAPTMEDVTSRPGYQTRLGAAESSAAARGSLFSGNALRNIGEFGSAEYGQEYNRRQTEYQNELNKRMGFANLGYGAAGGSAGIAQNLGQRLSQIQLGQGAAQSRAIGETAGGITGAIGSYQGQQNWNSFLNRIGSKKTSNSGWDENDYGVNGDDSDIGW